MAMRTRQLTRRHILALGALAAASIVSACGEDAASTATTAPRPPAGGATAPPAATAAGPAATVAPAVTTAPSAVAATAPATTGATVAAMAKPMVKGKLTVMRGTGNDAYWMDRVKEFQTKTGVTVEMVVTTGNVDDGTIPTALKSGSGPDTVNVNSGPSRVGFLAQAGLIRPLEDAYKTYGWESKLVPAVTERLRNQGKVYAGKVWEFPATIDVIYWDYHKDVYAKAGIKPPATFDEMNANFETLKKSGVNPVHLAARTNTPPGWLFGNIVQAVMGRDGVADVLFGNGAWDSPGFVQAAQVLADWSKKEYISKEVASLTDMEAYPLFVAKKSASFCVGTWAITTLADQMADLDNIETFAMPKITPQGTSIPTGGFGNSWVIAADSKNPDAAAAWIDYLFSDDVVKLGLESPRATNIPTVKVAPGVTAKSKLLAKAIEVLGRDGTGYNPSVHLAPSVTPVYFETLQGIVAGLVPPDKGMATIQAARVKAG